MDENTVQTRPMFKLGPEDPNYRLDLSVNRRNFVAQTPPTKNWLLNKQTTKMKQFIDNICISYTLVFLILQSNPAVSQLSKQQEDISDVSSELSPKASG